MLRRVGHAPPRERFRARSRCQRPWRRVSPLGDVRGPSRQATLNIRDGMSRRCTVPQSRSRIAVRERPRRLSPAGASARSPPARMPRDLILFSWCRRPPMPALRHPSRHHPPRCPAARVGLGGRLVLTYCTLQPGRGSPHPLRPPVLARSWSRSRETVSVVPAWSTLA